MRLIDDAAWAALTIWLEARGESPNGQLAVAEVVRNRLVRRYRSDGTVAGTVLAPLQFSCWNTGTLARITAAQVDADDPIVRACRAAWASAITAKTDVAKGAVLYYAPGIVPEPGWAAHTTRVAQIGRHWFFDDVR